MSDRPYPKILRTTEAADATLRTYARGAHLAPFEALILAIGLLRTRDEREAASEYNAAALDVARADLESAREATRRADAEVERITADWRAAIAETERVKALALERAGADATEIKRLREQYEAALDAVPSAAESRADQATITALRSELAEARAAIATKGATAALPDDFEAKLNERAPGWKGTAAELRARVITLGFSRYDALATDAAKRAAERGR